ncbi:hypothetical protein LguiA_033928 [Lonicera macranthoides]
MRIVWASLISVGLEDQTGPSYMTSTKPFSSEGKLVNNIVTTTNEAQTSRSQPQGGDGILPVLQRVDNTIPHDVTLVFAPHDLTFSFIHHLLDHNHERLIDLPCTGFGDWTIRNPNEPLLSRSVSSPRISTITNLLPGEDQTSTSEMFLLLTNKLFKFCFLTNM